MMPAGTRLTAWVQGRVQGVGFRWWVRSRALELGLAGFAENLADGRVKVVAEGSEDRCRDLLALLDGDLAAGPGGTGPRSRRPGRVSSVAHRWAAASGGFTGFTEK